MRSLERLLRPRSIAVVGGGAWCEAVVNENRKIGFAGEIWPVHPTRESVAGAPAFADLASLPAPPDAAFIGVNRHATVGLVAELSAMGAGGAVCFASGFEEAEDGAVLNRQLIAAAGDMPFLGPNCYGAVNALDRAALWPDQHGLAPVSSGVGIVAQSSNIAINLTMQARGLPIAYAVTIGNQAQQSLADVARLEWLWTRAFHAADRGPIGIEALAAIPPGDLDAVRFTLHPSVQLLQSRFPVVSLWADNTDRPVDGSIDLSTPETALLVRPQLSVDVHALSPGGDAFVAALAAGQALGQAVETAISADAAFDLNHHLAPLFSVGAVAAVVPPHPG